MMRQLCALAIDGQPSGWLDAAKWFQACRETRRIRAARAEISAKQQALRCRSTKSVHPLDVVLADAIFVEAEILAINLEKFFLRIPELAPAAHAIVKDTRVEFAVARVANTIQHAIGLCRKLVAQTLFEIGSYAARQTQHVDESLRRATIFRSFQ